MNSGSKKQPLVLPPGFSGGQLQKLKETATTRRALKKRLREFDRKAPEETPASPETKDRAVENPETKKPDSDLPPSPQVAEKQGLKEVKEPESWSKQPSAETFATLYSPEDLKELAKSGQLSPSLVKKYLKDKD